MLQSDGLLCFDFFFLKSDKKMKWEMMWKGKRNNGIHLKQGEMRLKDYQEGGSDQMPS